MTYEEAEEWLTQRGGKADWREGREGLWRCTVKVSLHDGQAQAHDGHHLSRQAAFVVAVANLRSTVGEAITGA